ncbi:LON peptidase substrate-binding domain-containing protein [Microbacterium sp. M3]|uniref:LON peptidase substrate-binding domain-containing protein n=1 Tax=Microbacterium arthrosphaerae TaxID=792652 RepID=A0ABU4H4N2_9MICO|nr:MULTISPECIES: LON peptidase substrate-binding domain-containing protein [Microbacterium]MDW4574284.1 LON peptidase substrate-binding domain-containing protein [Microbacterium arthrosphaerae]MDW7608139.1 LON peptidase substrate-binding domain-containing protein [Microbacterium sp. M3]
MDVVAMFPLGSVLFPYTPLVLRVFEPRYLTMMGHLLDLEEPEFGVVLIERGFEAGGGDQRASVGTMARILQVEAGATDLYVVAVGGERIAVAGWRQDDPHPVADVSTVPALVWDDALAPLHREAEQIVRRLATLASVLDEARWDPATPLSEDPVESAWQLAAIAPLGEYDRFRLLNSTSLGGLLRAIIDLCLEEEPVLIARAADARDEDDSDL